MKNRNANAPRLPSCRGDEALKSIEWPRVPLRDTCERIDYGFTASADFSIKEPRFLRITDIQNGNVDWDCVPGCRISEAEAEENRLEDGDIVFARTGATTGKSFLIRNPPKAVFASYLIRLRLRSGISPEFFSLFLQSEDYWEQIRAGARGGIQPNFNATMLGALSVLLPPLAEQRSLAAQLQEQLATVTQARTAVQAQLDAAQALPAAHLRAVFENEETEQWQRKRIDQIISRPLRTGLSKPSDPSSHHLCLTLSAVRNGALDFSASKTVAVTDREATENAVQKDTLYVVRGNGNISLVARGAIAPTPLPHPVLFPDLLIAVRPDPAVVLPQYLRCVWDSPGVRRALETRSMTSAGIYKINLTNLATVEIPVPSIFQQNAIVEAHQATSREQSVVSKAITDRLAALDRLPAALLRQAFSGRI